MCSAPVVGCGNFSVGDVGPGFLVAKAILQFPVARAGHVGVAELHRRDFKVFVATGFKFYRPIFTFDSVVPAIGGGGVSFKTFGEAYHAIISGVVFHADVVTLVLFGAHIGVEAVGAAVDGKVPSGNGFLAKGKHRHQGQSNGKDLFFHLILHFMINN